MTIGQFKNCIVGWRKAQEQQIKNIDYLNYVLGQYVGISVNNGKKYPKAPITHKSEQKRTRPMTIEEQSEAIKRIAHALN